MDFFNNEKTIQIICDTTVSNLWCQQCRWGTAGHLALKKTDWRSVTGMTHAVYMPETANRSKIVCTVLIVDSTFADSIATLKHKPLRKHTSVRNKPGLSCLSASCSHATQTNPMPNKRKPLTPNSMEKVKHSEHTTFLNIIAPLSPSISPIAIKTQSLCLKLTNRPLQSHKTIFMVVDFFLNLFVLQLYIYYRLKCL